jgi:hypothetical protein
MDVRKLFEYNPTIDLTAAQLGINKWQWETISSENEVEAKSIMKQKKYDVLPIRNPDGCVTKYFSTKEWNNYENLNLNEIDLTNSVYYRLSFNDLIRKFNIEQKRYYFLTNYDQILGLVSYINLNCLVVYNFLYQVIADLEQTIAFLLKGHLDQNDILEAFKRSGDKHQLDILANFEKSISDGNDNTIFDHMYLQTIGITLGKFLYKLPSKYHILSKYVNKFSSNGLYNELRRNVMHPVRPILNDFNTISKIDTLFTDFQAIKELLS